MPRTKGATTREYVPLDLADLADTQQAHPDEVAKLAPVRGYQPAERTPIMLKFDEDIEKLYTFWTEHGKPKPFTKEYPPLKVKVAPDKVPTVRFLAAKSAQFKGHGIQFGTEADLTDGRKCVSFCVTDKRERKAKPAADAPTLA
jgi:hypothetical protein